MIKVNNRRAAVQSPHVSAICADQMRLHDSESNSVDLASPGACGAPGGVEVVQAPDEDVLVDVADARAAGQLTHRQRLGPAVQHLRVPRRVAVEQLQQQRAPAGPGRSWKSAASMPVKTAPYLSRRTLIGPWLPARFADLAPNGVRLCCCMTLRKLIFHSPCILAGRRHAQGLLTH